MKEKEEHTRMELHNPLLPGFYPDPSICRVGDDFYMVTSSFAYYPGIPIFHSKNLAQWEQIGHVFDRPDQLRLNPYDISGGIYAPTLRYHKGSWYVITTNISHGGNFIVTAQNPKGPWSDPHWIKDAPGIDPSLFWDDDDRAYYTGTWPAEPGSDGKQMIWICEIDIETFTLIGEKTKIWGGASDGAYFPEGPHLYRIGGYYYLMVAEGGTEHFHCETIARSENLRGPYEGYRGNPILTQRHLGMKAAIVNAGHGDLVELQDGSWYMVFLASRTCGGYHKILGRETFIAPVEWEDGWPVVSPGTGSIESVYPGPDLPECAVGKEEERDDFSGGPLRYCWNYLGTPDEKTAFVKDNWLNIRLCRNPLKKQGTDHEDSGQTGFLGRRQQHMSFRAEVGILFQPEEEQTAGVVVLQHDFQQLRMEIGQNTDGQTVLRLIRGYCSLELSLLYKGNGAPYRENILNEIVWEWDEAVFIVEACGIFYTFTAVNKNGDTYILADKVDGSFLGSETAGGFVGAYIGMFASGNGKEYDKYAKFGYFSYRGEEK